VKLPRSFAAQLVTIGLLAATPAALWAAQPQQLPQKTFDVRVQGGSTPMVEVTFALALSEVSSYPVTITAIGGAVEEQLYEGQLSEGIYQLIAPLTKVGSGPLKVVLKTRVTNRNAQGAQSSLRYLTWEGTLSR